MLQTHYYKQLHIVAYTVKFSQICWNIFITHPASYPMDTGVPTLGVKRPKREANHSPPSRAEIKNGWSYTSTPPYVCIAWCLIKHEGQLYILFT
jgi:hypothetical protein